MFNQITSRLLNLDADLKVASPTAHLNANKWMASTACEYTLGSYIDDQVARNDEYYAVREEKRGFLNRILAFAMDNGVPSQVICGDGDTDTEHGLINEAIRKELERSFKAKAISQEHMELLIECGEDEEVLTLMNDAENAKNERIANKRKNSMKERESELRHLMSHWFMDVFQASANIDSLPAYLLKIVISKYDYALQAQRKYCIRGIQMGAPEAAGELSAINAIIKKGDIKWCYDRLDELDRQSNFADDPTELYHRGRTGDNERPDITY